VEAVGYVAGRIRIAGGAGPRVFTRDAIELMHAVARGIPRTISVIADNALVGGFAAGERPVTSRIVRDVSRDFDLSVDEPVQPAAPAAAGKPPGAAAPDHTRGPRPGLLGYEETPIAPREAKVDRSAAVDVPGMFGAFSNRRKRFSFFWS
jgi:hypothetical protein